MSEKIYARLLRLYPSAFRKEYEGEALQLIRDRLRDETGIFNRARLWWNLATDIVTGLPQAYGNSYAATEAAPLSASPGSIPSFKVLDREPLRPGSILVAGTLSLATVVGFGFLMTRPIAYLPLSGSNGRMSPIEAVLQRLNRAMDPDSAVSGNREAAKGASAETSERQARPSSALATASAPKPNTRAMRAESKNGVGTGDRVVSIQTQSLNEHGADSAMRHRAVEALTQRENQSESGASGNAPANGETDGASLDAAERQRVLDRVIANVRQYYFDRDIAKKTADTLLAHEKAGDYEAVTDGAAFADLLTRQMRDASGDMHLMMEYSRDKLPDGPPAQTPEDLARFRAFLEQNNCFIRKVEMLPHQIGYLKLDWFSEPSICRPAAVAAMAQLNNAKAVIFDLRDNRGGAPGSTVMFAAYLFDHPEYWYSPREVPNEESWTRSPVPGNKLADKPVYVLTSSSTWSGAEQFSYDLKMLKRATLVGETTRGGAHAGVFHRIDDHFGMGIPEKKAINPFGKADWEGVGVEPDVKVKAADALETAIKLARDKQGNK
jgi:Peptidase family S41/N-terminal domain of Peptidase_S41 in eukaryotic IRBP